jgi:hypothetical protein
VPQHSIDRLYLGMASSQVRRLLGRPDRVEHSSESETGKPISDWVYRKSGLTAEFRRVKDGRVSLAGISTTSRGERTASGLGIDSTERELRRDLGAVQCISTDLGQRWCSIGKGALGSPETLFVLRRGRVTEVRVLITFP